MSDSTYVEHEVSIHTAQQHFVALLRQSMHLSIAAPRLTASSYDDPGIAAPFS